MFDQNSGQLNAVQLPPATGSSVINISTGERIISVLGGLALASVAMRNIKQPRSIAMLLGGGYLLVRGATGYCSLNTRLQRNTVYKKASAIQISNVLTINKPRSEVYAFWRKLENLPRFMRHLVNVMQIDEKRSHWTAAMPRGLGRISWQAEITDDRPDEYIAWESLPGSLIDNAGSVVFKDAPGVDATEVTAVISYRLPAGDAGALAAKLVNPYAEQLIRNDLSRFKSVIETGKIPPEEDKFPGTLGNRIRAKISRMKRHEDAILKRSL
jgi:uncharacterized membrane protein